MLAIDIDDDVDAAACSFAVLLLNAFASAKSLRSNLSLPYILRSTRSSTVLTPSFSNCVIAADSSRRRDVLTMLGGAIDTDSDIDRSMMDDDEGRANDDDADTVLIVASDRYRFCVIDTSVFDDESLVRLSMTVVVDRLFDTRLR